MLNLSYENEFNLHVNEIIYERMCTKTRFEEEAKGNSEVACLQDFIATVNFWPFTRLLPAGLFCSSPLARDSVKGELARAPPQEEKQFSPRNSSKLLLLLRLQITTYHCCISSYKTQHFPPHTFHWVRAQKLYTIQWIFRGNFVKQNSDRKKNEDPLPGFMLKKK